MKIAVVGTGYVGLVTAACLADSGHLVRCIDNNEEKISALKKGQVPIFEPGLEEKIKRSQERLSYTADLEDGVKQAEIIFLALPTPPNEDGSADLSVTMSVSMEIGKYLSEGYTVVINKSTVPVGTAESIQGAITENAKGDFDVVSNPEFLREGLAINDFMAPERVVVGVESPKAEKVMRKLYEPFTDEKRPLLVTDRRTAELIKYAANTFLVTKISFMNEIAQLCERMGADVDMVRQAIGADSRIGPKFLYPGIGSGGSCFPKDIRALKFMSKELGYDFKLLAAAMSINDQQKLVLINKLLNHFDDNIAGLTFGLWGLAFKPGTDDIREAPALVIIEELLSHGASVKAYDPEAGKHVKKLFDKNPNVQIVADKYDSLTGSSALLIATEWPEFTDSDLTRVSNKLLAPVIFDGRNIFNVADMKDAGFTYFSIGRQPVVQ